MMLPGCHIVLVEDDATMGHSLVQRLELEGARVTWVKQMVRGISAVRTPHHPVDAVICDIALPDGTGETIFSAVAASVVPPPFFFITGQGDIDQAVRLLRSGASDYLTKPFDMGTLLDRLAMLIRQHSRGQELAEIIGISSLAKQVEAQIESATSGEGSIFLRGERGLGKRRIALRMAETMGATVSEIVEVDGATANGTALANTGDGVLIVHAPSKLCSDDQAELLNIVRGGNLRVLVIGGQSVDEDVKAGTLRQDLYFTLVENVIEVPPLRQRPDDAAWLAEQFFGLLNSRRGAPLRGLSELSISAVRDHDWPGNGREMRARLSRAIASAEHDWIQPIDLFPEFTSEQSRLQTLAEVRGSAERQHIQRALSRTGGQIAEAARLLGVSRTTLWEKMQKLDL